MKHPFRPMYAALLTALVSGACVGTIGDGTIAGKGSGASGPADADAAGAGNSGAPATLTGNTATGDPNAAGLRPLLRLSSTEYLNTVRDLFADPSIAVDLPPDPLGDSGFAEAPIVSDDTADTLRGAAEQLASHAMTNLSKVMGCDPAKVGETPCAQQFVSAFGRRAYRRALDSSDIDPLMALYQSARTTLSYGFNDAVRVLLEAMLQSPNFLYHWERGSSTATAQANVIALSGFELASRLSYFLWSSMPDDTLLDAAAGGTLVTDDGLGAQIDRMLKSDKLLATTDAFHTQWLGLGADAQKDPTLFPGFNPALAQAMRDETNRFLRYVFLEGDGRFSTLLTSTVADVDPLTAGLYGVAAPSSGIARVQLDSSTRGGLLTRAALLTVDSDAAQTNPPRSGKMLWTKVLCKTISPPPPGAAASFQFDNALSTRDNFTKLQSQPACMGCHAIINPLGFAYEGFDAIGRTRKLDRGHPVDSSGTYAASSGSKPFGNIADLSRILASDPDATSCVAKTWFHFAVERADTSADTFSLETAFSQFSTTSFDLRALLKGLAMSHTFRYRALEQGETL